MDKLEVCGDLVDQFFWPKWKFKNILLPKKMKSSQFLLIFIILIHFAVSSQIYRATEYSSDRCRKSSSCQTYGCLSQIELLSNNDTGSIIYQLELNYDVSTLARTGSNCALWIVNITYEFTGNAYIKYNGTYGQSSLDVYVKNDWLWFQVGNCNQNLFVEREGISILGLIVIACLSIVLLIAFVISICLYCHLSGTCKKHSYKPLTVSMGQDGL
jgi:hypothetical protein